MEDRKRKIIFINQYTGYLFIDIINSFADKCICELYTGEIDEIDSKVKSSVKIHKLIAYSRNSPLKRIVTWLIFTLQCFLKLCFIDKTTEVFLVSNPPFSPFLGYLFHKLKGIKYYLLIYDVYPDVLVNFRMIKKDGVINRNWSKFNLKIFQNAEIIFTISEGMSSLIKKYYQGGEINVIPNWTNNLYIKPIAKELNPFAIKYKQVNKLTIMYSGNMGATHAIEKIAELALILKFDRIWEFILIGDGVKKDFIRKLKEENSLDNLILLEYQARDVLPYSLACADVGIVTLSPGAENLSVPSKTYNLLAAGVIVLVIAPANSELARLINRYNCGKQFEENQTNEMIAFLNSIKADSKLFHEMKVNARNASYDFTNKNAAIYNEILGVNILID